MQVEQIESQDLIERSLSATENAIGAIREGDLVRRQTSLELRDMQLSLHEDFERMRSLMRDFDEQLHSMSTENSKWLDRKMNKARLAADEALSSVLMVKDVQLLEKKVNILKDSEIQLNKAYYEYEKQVDMKDLMEQVTEMVYRTEKKEKEVLGGKMADEETIEKSFRRAIEGLYGIKSANPKLLEEAKKLATEMRVFRDAAANKNFFTMISKSKNEQDSSCFSSASTSSSSSQNSSAEVTPSTTTTTTTTSSN